jgi:hypothetical protein
MGRRELLIDHHVYIPQKLASQSRPLWLGKIGYIPVQYTYRIGLAAYRVIGVRIICIGAYRDEA